MALLVRAVAILLGWFAAIGAADALSGLAGWAVLAVVIAVPTSGGIVYASVIAAADQLFPRRRVTS